MANARPQASLPGSEAERARKAKAHSCSVRHVSMTSQIPRATTDKDIYPLHSSRYDPDIGGVRLEDMLVVTADGARNLTRAPRELVV